MLTILFVTSEPAHRFLYEQGLKQHFQLVFIRPGAASVQNAVAIVCDLSRSDSSSWFPWIEGLGLPVVVLTPEPRLPVPQAERQRVLEYPVSAQELLRALAELGVTP